MQHKIKKYWCRGEDLNLHILRYQLLRLACLPISPPRQNNAYTIKTNRLIVND